MTKVTSLILRRMRIPLLVLIASYSISILGFVMILAGIAMLVLPGQGILTILMGVALANFPGKFTLERRLVRQPSVGRTLNRIREFAGKPQLEIPAREV